MVKVIVQQRSSSSKKHAGKPARPAVEIDFPSRHPNAVTVNDLKGAVEAKFPRLAAVRQRLTTESNTVLADGDRSLGNYGVQEGETLYLKDLGRQISWRTVFVIEYLGPLLIHPLFYFLHNQIFGFICSLTGERMVPYETSDMQRVAFALITFHFLKREYETLFVHRFSNATMPFRNVFKNSAHYHLLSGVLLSFGLYGPWNSSRHLPSSQLKSSPKWLTFWAVFILWAQASNLYTHLTLRSLRPEGTRKRSIPTGYGFNSVFCANYLFESLVWIGTTIMTGSLSCAAFTAVSVGQMVIWALKKKKAYKKEFGDRKDFPKGRKAIFPWLI